jgi:hypothetical protein
MKRISLAFAATALLSAPALQAQSIASDRPGIGSGSAVIGHKTVQLETGFDYTKTDTSDTYSIGQLLIRAGAPWFELEVFANSYVITRSDLTDDVGDDEGFQDLAIGVKVPLLVGAGGRLSLSAQGILQTPSGSDIFTNDEWVPTANLLLDLGISDRLAVSVNTGYQAGPGTVDDVFTLFVTPGVDLGGGFGAYAGWAGFFSDLGNTHFGEGGITYLANSNVQLDLNSGWDVDTDDYFLGFGLAVRRQ